MNNSPACIYEHHLHAWCHIEVSRVHSFPWGVGDMNHHVTNEKKKMN